MSWPAQPRLKAGRVYRTRDLSKWGVNTPRLAKRLVAQGYLVPLAHGLFAYPERSRFGEVPPSDDELMRAFLDGAPFVLTGSHRWNALGLGSTAVFATPLVYNTKRSGIFDFGGRRFLLRRVAFPADPPAEWFVVDLLENSEKAGVSRSEVASALARALGRGTFDRERLHQLAHDYGSKKSAALVDAALEATST